MGATPRLGNWLFLYAGIQALLKDTGNSLYVPSNYFLWKYLKEPPSYLDSDSYQELFHFRKHEYSDEEKDWLKQYFIENKDKVININIGSNLQDERWFIHEKNYVIQKLSIKDEFIEKVKEKYQYIFTKPTIGIGIRRGDFVGHGDFFQIPDTWYEDSLYKYFPNWQEYNIVVFSDDIEWCKKRYGNKFFYADSNNTHTHADRFTHYHKDPMDQFILGTLMDHYIGGNSTFSWWHMWWVKNINNGKVVHCGENLSHTSKHYNNPNYYPNDWNLYKI